MGRWSRLSARSFLKWFAIAPGRSWLDVGCGTGSLTKLILENCQPKEITAIDSSSEFIGFAEESIKDPLVDFKVSLAQALELETNSVDAAVSGFVLNFIPEPELAIADMLRVTKPGGRIGIFIWDYADGMEMLRYFWDAAITLDHTAEGLDEGVRFLLCREGELEALAKNAGLKQVEAKPIDVRTVFQNFDDYWEPFLGNVGPAPAYLKKLKGEDRQKLKENLRSLLPIDDNGSISLLARAWAIKGAARY